MRRRPASLLTVLLTAALTLGCGGKASGPQPTVTPATPVATPRSAPVSPASFKPPADHVKDRKGAMHKKGSKQAAVNCVECHGADLRGGAAPSCYTCHGKEWK